MACENDKCEKYGLHHDYKDGIEIRKCFACERDNQPDRLNPETILKDCIKNMINLNNEIVKAQLGSSGYDSQNHTNK